MGPYQVLLPGQEDLELTSAGSLLPEVRLSHLRVPTRYRPSNLEDQGIPFCLGHRL